MRSLGLFLFLVGCAAFPRARVSQFQSPKLKRNFQLQMAKIGRGAAEVEGSGKVAVLTKTRVDEQTEVKEMEDLDKEQWWRVLLHNDEIHTFEYVIEEITQVVPTVTRRKAFDMAMTTHRDGQATVAVVWKKLAEQYCLGLQKAGLTSSIAPDSNFQNNKSNE